MLPSTQLPPTQLPPVRVKGNKVLPKKKYFYWGGEQRQKKWSSAKSERARKAEQRRRKETEEGRKEEEEKKKKKKDRRWRRRKARKDRDAARSIEGERKEEPEGAEKVDSTILKILRKSPKPKVAQPGKVRGKREPPMVVAREQKSSPIMRNIAHERMQERRKRSMRLPGTETVEKKQPIIQVSPLPVQAPLEPMPQVG